MAPYTKTANNCTNLQNQKETSSATANVNGSNLLQKYTLALAILIIVSDINEVIACLITVNFVKQASTVFCPGFQKGMVPSEKGTLPHLVRWTDRQKGTISAVNGKKGTINMVNGQ